MKNIRVFLIIAAVVLVIFVAGWYITKDIPTMDAETSELNIESEYTLKLDDFLPPSNEGNDYDTTLPESDAIKPDPALIVTEEEKQAFTEECQTLGALYKELFVQAEKTPSPYSGGNDEITQPWKDKIEEVLIGAGYPILNSDSVYPTYLEKPEGVYLFWDGVEAGKNTEAAFWGVSADGGLYYTCLTFQDGNQICTHATADWNDELELELGYMEKREVFFWSMTQDQDLYYQDWRLDRHWTATKLIRLHPVNKDLFDLGQKYIEPIGYHNVNLFLLDWDSENYGNVSLNDLLGGLYRIKYNDYLYARDFPSADNPFHHSLIPAELFEEIVLPHFDISLDDFRERTLYDPESNTYPWQDIMASNVQYYPDTIPEVTDCITIDSNTFKLVVRVMCTDYHSDCALIHEVTIRELPDGGWQYLGNQVTFRDNVEQPSPQARIEAQRFSE